nr:MAG TPA: hypothetical protein [Caudoviricetes sp.]
MTKLETFSRMLFANNRLLFDDISFFFYDARDVEGETSYFDIQLLDADNMLYHPDEIGCLIYWLEHNCEQEEDLGDDNSKYIFDNFYVLLTHGGEPQ